MRTRFLIWLICGLAPVLFAQEPPSASPGPTPPPEPLLGKAPDFAQWTITSSEAVDPREKPSPMEAAELSPASGRHHKKQSTDSTDQKAPVDHTDQTTTVTKTKSFRVERTESSGGMKIERWCLPDMQIIIPKSGEPIVAMPGSALDSNYIDYSKAEFIGFDWISQSNFEGIENVSGQECHVFRQKVKADGAGAAGPSGMVAWINTATQLPVKLQSGEESRTYHFEVAPTAMLALPPEVAAMAHKWEESVRQSSLMPAKP